MRHFLAVMLASSSLFAQANVDRPHILGLAHVAFRVSDVGRSGAFYENVLGLTQAFALTDEDGKTTMAVVKVNDEQYIELLQGENWNQGQLDHFALYTDDVAAMREYLMARQVPLLRDIHEGRVGNPFLTVRDADGWPIEILEYSSSSLTGQSKGRFMPAGSLVSHINHVGILVRSVGSAIRFYRDVLGFREFSRASGGPGRLDRMELLTADGSDYIELLPLAGVPSASDMKARNHVCLATSDLGKTVAILQPRLASSLLSSPLAVQTKGDLPPHADLFDPDGARIEIVETMSAGAPRTIAPHP